MKRFKSLAAVLAVCAMCAAAAVAGGIPELVESESAPMINLFADSPPVITDLAVYPANPYDDESVTISARVYADPNAASMALERVELWYKIDGAGDWVKSEMLKSPEGPDVFFAVVTPAAGAKSIVYSVIATDIGGNMSVVLPPMKNVDIKNEDDFFWVADADEADDVVPREIDFLALGVARDAENLYIVEKTQDTPGPGNMSKGGANFYFAPFFPPTEGIASFLGGQCLVLGYMPLAASILGIPKHGLFNIKDVISGNKNIPKSEVKLIKGKDRLGFTVPLKELGAGDEWITGLASGRIIGVTSIAPMDAGPFTRLIMRGGEVALRAAAGRKPAPLRAGAAKVDISSPIGTPLAGYGDRVGVPSVGIHDPLMAAALVIESEGRYYCFAGLDMFYMRLDIYDEVARRLHAATGLPEGCLFLGASHSHHASGALVPELSILGGKFQPEVFEQVVQKIVDGLTQAYKNLQPAKLGVGWIEMESGKYTAGNRRSESGKVDTVIGVIRVDALDGKPIATLFNQSGHPTGIESKKMLMSSDFVGPARDAIEKQGGGVAVFFNGSLGDHSARCPGDCPSDDYENVKKKGEAVADYVVKARAAIKPEEKVTIRGVTSWMILNRRRQNYTVEKAVVFDNRYVFVTIPGELFFDPLGSQLREQAKAEGFEQLFVLGLTNDGLGYVYPEELYYSHAYEATYSAFGPKMSPFIFGNASAIVSGLGEGKAK